MPEDSHALRIYQRETSQQQTDPCSEMFRVEGFQQMNLLKKFFSDESGAELAEYAVACAILVAIAVIVYNVLGEAINNKMNDVASQIDAPPAADPPPAGP
jgi:Flp pilus assembly pilin Flp